MNTLAFFAKHPIFTVEEFDRFLEKHGSGTLNNRKGLLRHHRAQGRIALIRHGLYGVVPLGSDTMAYPFDSYLVATRLRSDAVIGYHSALAFHGVAHSLRADRVIITHRPMPAPFVHRGITYRTVLPPHVLVEKRLEEFGVERHERQALPVRVTGLERTFVDCLDRPRLCGGWEEVWRSSEGVPYLDVDLLVDYALLLDNATTIATVGYFLQSAQERWMVPGEALERLRAHRPKQPHYLGRLRDEPGRLDKEWNLIVPDRIVDRAWEEIRESIA